MPWFKLDDKSHSNKKVVAAGNAAWGLYCRCGAYAADNLTDGFVPEQIARLFGDDTLIGALLEHRLWRRARGGYKMPDYLDYNPSKEAVENQREANRRRQQAWRNGVTNGVSVRAPTRPVDKRDEASTTGGRTGRSKPDLSSLNGAATPQPPPFAQAVDNALNPERTP